MNGVFLIICQIFNMDVSSETPAAAKIFLDVAQSDTVYVSRSRNYYTFIVWNVIQQYEPRFLLSLYYPLDVVCVLDLLDKLP